MIDLTWVLSIFKFSRAGNSDARSFRLRHHNFKPRRDTTFSRPNSNHLASTSASILKAGLHRVWRTTGKSKAPSEPQKEELPFLNLGHVPKSAPITHCAHLPPPQTGHPVRQPADTQHSSPPRFFHLHKAANKKPDSEQSSVRPPKLATSRACPFPQPAAVPNRFRIVSFGSSTVKGSESAQRNVGLNIFTAGQYSSSRSSFQVTFVPKRVSPSQSLLFLPPTPPPKRKNLEEDTVPLPPASEPKLKSNQSFTTSPVRSLDHISPSLPTDQIVPCSPLFPTQNSNSLSPLPIAMSFPLAAPPLPELVIKITGPEGYLIDHKTQISNFLSSRATDVANSLVVIWQLSHIDGGDRRGLESLKTLFAQLDEKVLDSDRTALSKFTKVSITIPDQVKDVAQPVKEDDKIDLANAMDLHEFTWHGDFVVFATKLTNLSLVTLTCLNIKTSIISIEDAITLLHSCPVLQKVSLGTIGSEEETDIIMSMKSKGVVERKALPNLTYLALESDVALHPLIRRFRWTTQVSLNLTLRNQGTASLVQALDSGLP